MVIGGQAVLMYGEPRLTRDIDITLGASLDRLPELVGISDRIGFKILVNPYDFTIKTLVLPCQDRETGIRVNYIFSWSAYEQEALVRARSIDFGGTWVKFASVEDVVIHKIIAGRPRDVEDVRLLLMKNPGFDRQYIQGWLTELDEALGEGFESRFQQVRRESQKYQ